MTSTGRALGRLWSIVAWVVVLATAALLLVAVLVPRLGGATPYTVLTGSMQPDLPAGALVVVRPVPAEEIGVGSVITYQLVSGEATVVTHRVVAVRMGADGEPAFRTQGDANDVPDTGWVRPVQVRGELWYSVPYLGHLNQLLTGEERQLAVYAVAAGLLFYAAATFVSIGRRRRPSPAHVADEAREAHLAHLAAGKQPDHAPRKVSA